MAACGLVNGKINSYNSFHFAPEFSGGAHLVEDITPPGLLADNARVQAQLEPVDGGTRIQLDAIRVKGQFDFGASSRLKKRYATNTQEFLLSVPADWSEHIEGKTQNKLLLLLLPPIRPSILPARRPN